MIKADGALLPVSRSANNSDMLLEFRIFETISGVSLYVYSFSCSVSHMKLKIAHHVRNNKLKNKLSKLTLCLHRR